MTLCTCECTGSGVPIEVPAGADAAMPARADAACGRRTCADLPGQCGRGEDGCGGTLDCPCPCLPTGCAAVGLQCGELWDGCSTWLRCGPDCPGPDAGCQPTTCQAEAVTCGLLEDGCGATLRCGPECAGPDAGCEAVTCVELALGCGPANDRCGTMLDCGTCRAGGTCAAGRCYEADCGDNSDNDDDAAVDCADPDCVGSPGCSQLANGRACLDDGQCLGGICLTEEKTGLPSNSCSEPCTVQGNACHHGGFCQYDDVVLGSSGLFCFPPCQTRSDCRSGYTCTGVPYYYTTRPPYWDPGFSLESASAVVCVPMCSRDEQCIGGRCNLSLGHCTTGEPTGLPVGSPCERNEECAGNLCGTDEEYLGGYCGSACDPIEDRCPGDAVCDRNGPADPYGWCYDGCAIDEDCRVSEGYGCFVARSGTPTVKACFPRCQPGILPCTTQSDCQTCPGSVCDTLYQRCY
ncbi:MAG: hypothetical protein QM765_28285 [Myxococcales bacterium]